MFRLSGQNLKSHGIKISQEVFVVSNFQMMFLLIFCFVELFYSGVQNKFVCSPDQNSSRECR